MASVKLKFLLALAIALYAIDWGSLLGLGTRTHFDPIVCAQLHNELLMKAFNKTAIASIPSSSHSYADIFHESFTRFVIDNPKYADPNLYTSSSLFYKFLSLIKTPLQENFPTDDGWSHSAFTPAFQPLHPERFFDASEYFLHGFHPEPSVVLLYRDVAPDKFINGIFFDLKSQLATWHYSLDRFDLSKGWVPLETVLRKWLRMWEIGKYAHREKDERLEIYEHPWIELDVEESIKEWEALIFATEARRTTRKDDRQPTMYQPIKATLLEAESYNSFAGAFLSRARIPNFRYIAPGITYFTNETFRSLYASEPPDSWRRKNNAERAELYGYGGDDDRMSLIFPAVSPVPKVKALQQQDRGYYFDYAINFPAGWARFTVNRMAGLYSNHNDEIRFFDLGGGADAFSFDTGCPWSSGRGPRLAEVLKRWRELIEKGVWSVGPDGVWETEGWWESNAGSKHIKLSWGKDSR